WESTARLLRTSVSPGHRIASPAAVATASITATAVSARFIQLEIAHRIDGGPVDPDLEVQVRTGRVAGVAAVADHLALRDRGAVRGGEAGLVGVAGGHARRVLDAGVVAVAADIAHERDAPGVGRADRRPRGDRDVDAGVHVARARLAENARHGTVQRPDQLPRALLDRPRRTLEGAGHARLLGLERGE